MSFNIINYGRREKYNAFIKHRLKLLFIVYMISTLDPKKISNNDIA